MFELDIMKAIFFHIPRTAGSTMWHSIANSYAGFDVHILDARHQSLLQYNCEHHQQEILDIWLLDSEIKDVIIHVHGELDLKSRKDIDLVVSGTRKIFSWRTSYLAHKNIKSLYAENQVVRTNNCEHRTNCASQDFTRLRNIKGFFEIISSSIVNWKSLILEDGIKQNYQIIFYDESTKSKIECARRLGKLMLDDYPENTFTLKRYAESQEFENRPQTSHDSRGLIKFFGVLLNVVTLPIFIYENKRQIIKSARKKIKQSF